MKNKKCILPIVAMFALVVMPLVMAASYGISPSIVYLEDILRGESYERYFKVINLEDFEKDLKVEVTGDVAPWITLHDLETKEEITQITVPAKSSVEFIAKVDVPEDVPNGVYEGYLQVSPAEAEEQAEGNVVHLVVRGKIAIKVTGEEIIEGRVDSIVAKDAESGQPLRIIYDFANLGNVGVIPHAEVTITKDGKEVDSFVYNGTYVNAGEHATQEVVWDTENQGTGTFNADVKVYLYTDELYSKEVEFEVMPRGTYTAEAIVGDYEKDKDWVVDRPGKTQLKFYNTGKIDVMAKVTVEVTKDDKIVDVVTSDEKLVKSGDSDYLTFYYTPTASGDYVLKGKVTYAGKEQSLADMQLQVSDTGGDEYIAPQSNLTTIVYILGGVIVLLVLVVAVIGVLYLRRSKK